jgi:hypothetical protein
LYMCNDQHLLQVSRLQTAIHCAGIENPDGHAFLQVLRLLMVVHSVPLFVSLNMRTHFKGSIPSPIARVTGTAYAIFYSTSHFLPTPYNHFVFGCGVCAVIYTALSIIRCLAHSSSACVQSSWPDCSVQLNSSDALPSSWA